MSGGPAAAIREQCPLASEQYDGLMAAGDKKKLDGLSGRGTLAFDYIIQIGDNDDFFVTIPVALQAPQPYAVFSQIGTAGVFTQIAVDFASQTETQFRVTTDGILPIGTVLLFSIKDIVS